MLKRQSITINEHILLLLSKIREWKQNHVITSKIGGILTFNQDWQAHQFVNINDVIFNITPPSQQMSGWMKVKGNGTGNIKPGQKVQVELENYPALKYGFIEGTVNSINLIPDQHGYLVKLKFKSPLVTTYNISLEGQSYLIGSGKIITQPRRLLTRFTDKIFYALNFTEL